MCGTSAVIERTPSFSTCYCPTPDVITLSCWTDPSPWTRSPPRKPSVSKAWSTRWKVFAVSARMVRWRLSGSTLFTRTWVKMASCVLLQHILTRWGEGHVFFFVESKPLQKKNRQRSIPAYLLFMCEVGLKFNNFLSFLLLYLLSFLDNCCVNWN